MRLCPQVRAGARLAKPTNWSATLFDKLVRVCWPEKPEHSPTFSVLREVYTAEHGDDPVPDMRFVTLRQNHGSGVADQLDEDDMSQYAYSDLSQETSAEFANTTDMMPIDNLNGGHQLDLFAGMFGSPDYSTSRRSGGSRSQTTANSSDYIEIDPGALSDSGASVYEEDSDSSEKYLRLLESDDQTVASHAQLLLTPPSPTASASAPALTSAQHLGSSCSLGQQATTGSQLSLDQPGHGPRSQADQQSYTSGRSIGSAKSKRGRKRDNPRVPHTQFNFDDTDYYNIDMMRDVGPLGHRHSSMQTQGRRSIPTQGAMAASSAHPQPGMPTADHGAVTAPRHRIRSVPAQVSIPLRLNDPSPLRNQQSPPSNAASSD